MYKHVNEGDTGDLMLFLKTLSEEGGSSFFDNTNIMKMQVNSISLARYYLYKKEQEVIYDESKENFIGLFVENNYRNSASINFIFLKNDSQMKLQEMINYIKNEMGSVLVKEVNKLVIDLDSNTEFFKVWENRILAVGFNKCTLAKESRLFTYELLL